MKSNKLKQKALFVLSLSLLASYSMQSMANQKTLVLATQAVAAEKKLGNFEVIARKLLGCTDALTKVDNTLLKRLRVIAKETEEVIGSYDGEYSAEVKEIWTELKKFLKEVKGKNALFGVKPMLKDRMAKVIVHLEKLITKLEKEEVSEAIVQFLMEKAVEIEIALGITKKRNKNKALWDNLFQKFKNKKELSLSTKKQLAIAQALSKGVLQ